MFFIQTKRAHAVEFLLRSYFIALTALVNIYGVPTIRPGYEHGSLLPTWPVMWLEAVGLKYGAPLIVFGCMFSLIVAALFPLKQWTRALAFLFLFLFNAYNSSFGGVTHLYQFWLWSCFFIAIMPTVKNLDSRIERQKLISGWLMAQSIVLIFYFLSGFWKTFGAIQQFFNNEPHVFGPSGIGYHVASEVIRAGMNPLIGRLFIDHPYLSPPFAILVAAVQIGSIVIVFKYKWHRVWGLALLGFHLGTYLVLSINYPTNFLLVGLFFVASPFTSGEINFRKLWKKYFYSFKSQ